MDETAQALGLQPGFTLAAARARVPELKVEDADPAADAILLRQLAEACRRYTPAVSLDPPDALNLDITGAAHLFGGEDNLLAQLRERFQTAGVSTRCAAASNPAAAYAFARYPTCAEGEEADRLANLPVAALRLEDEATDVLQKLGLRRIRQLIDLPRASVALRLKPETLQRLDVALGESVTTLKFIAEVAPFLTEARLFDPISNEAQVMQVCLRLARRLSDQLQQTGVGGRVFALDLFRVDGAVKRVEVQASRPLANPPRIAALFVERLAALNEGLEADFGFDLLRLGALRVDRMQPRPGDLLTQGDGEGDFLAFVDRVRARFGEGVVKRFAPALESRLPEAAVRETPAALVGDPLWAGEASARYEGVPLRPVTLFSPPQPISAIAGVPEDPPASFIWRKVRRQVVCAEGPERIAGEWWRIREPCAQGGEDEAPNQAREDATSKALAPIRDYYRLEDAQGRRYWVFREGLYAPTAPPRWYLHGLFA